MQTEKGFEQFIAMAKDNPALKQELTAFEGQSYDATGAGIVALGAKHGFTFTADEVTEAIDETIADKALKSDELSDEELELVAGGKGGVGEAALVLIGTIGDLIDGLTD